jgi:hypothetical protein
MTKTKTRRRKSAEKSAVPPQFRAWVFQPGPDPRRGHGPAKGTGGRPRNEFKQEMRALASDDAIIARLRDILNNCTDPVTFIRALAFATEHGYGKATQPIAATGDQSAEVDELRNMTDAELLEHFQALRATHREPSRN